MTDAQAVVLVFVIALYALINWMLSLKHIKSLSADLESARRYYRTHLASAREESFLDGWNARVALEREVRRQAFGVVSGASSRKVN